MEPALAETLFESLYADVDGYCLSSYGKNRLGLAAETALTYGEIAWNSFAEIMAEVNARGHFKTFYDLGSGTGKPVIAAALLGNFQTVLGIELVDELYHAAKQALFHFNKKIRPLLLPERRNTTVDFIHGNMFEHHWGEADVIFIQTTCVGDNLMAALEERFQHLHKGSLVITTSCALTSTQFRIIFSKKVPFGWGLATVIIQEKIV